MINADNPDSVEMTRNLPGRRLHFPVRGPADGWYDRTRGLRLGRQVLLPREELPLLGDHNVANALAAALAVHGVGVELDSIAEGLRTFRGLPHRMETVREVRGVTWINDSKATNLSSTAVAVAALDRPFVLLLGGRHKGAPYTSLGDALKSGCRAVIAYGEAQPIILTDLAASGVPVEPAGTFEQVMERARALARRATWCFSLPPARAMTCSPTTRSGAPGSGRWSAGGE